MTIAQMLETIMLMLFSLGWCASIAAMLRTRRPVAKSPLFVALIWIGYLTGILAKIAAWHATGLLSPVVWVYAFNAGIILLDTGLCVVLARAVRAADRPQRSHGTAGPPAPAPSYGP